MNKDSVAYICTAKLEQSMREWTGRELSSTRLGPHGQEIRNRTRTITTLYIKKRSVKPV